MELVNPMLGDTNNKPKVIFRIKDLVFELPPDFAGTVSDAFRMIADYYESMSNRVVYTGKEKEKFDAFNAVLTELKENPEDTHGRLAGTFGLFREVDGEYILIE